jgi:hypothetical protein
MKYSCLFTAKFQRESRNLPFVSTITESCGCATWPGKLLERKINIGRYPTALKRCAPIRILINMNRWNPQLALNCRVKYHWLMPADVEENAKSMEEIHGRTAAAAPEGRESVSNCWYVPGRGVCLLASNRTVRCSGCHTEDHYRCVPLPYSLLFIIGLSLFCLVCNQYSWFSGNNVVIRHTHCEDL